MNKVRKAFVVAAVLCLWPAAALAAPASEPRAAGPWSPTYSPPTCDAGPLEYSDGTVAVDTRTCEWWFQYATASETDTTRDYGILWLHTRVDPRPGFCVRKVLMGLQAGDGFSAHAATRPRDVVIRAGRHTKMQLATDARGNGLQEASVEQDVLLRPGRLEVRRLSTEGWSRGRWTAAGPQTKPVDLALGIEVSWETDPLSALTAVYMVGSDLDVRFGRC